MCKTLTLTKGAEPGSLYPFLNEHYLNATIAFVEASWNVMAHAQKTVFVFRTSPFKSAGASVQSITDSRGVRICGSNAGYTMFRGSVKSTGYRLHSPVSPSLPLPCVTVCHHISTGLYYTEEECQASAVRVGIVHYLLSHPRRHFRSYT
jgi:hypothetical protein